MGLVLLVGRLVLSVTDREPEPGSRIDLCPIRLLLAYPDHRRFGPSKRSHLCWSGRHRRAHVVLGWYSRPKRLTYDRYKVTKACRLCAGSYFRDHRHWACLLFWFLAGFLWSHILRSFMVRSGHSCGLGFYRPSARGRDLVLPYPVPTKQRLCSLASSSNPSVKPMRSGLRPPRAAYLKRSQLRGACDLHT